MKGEALGGRREGEAGFGLPRPLWIFAWGLPVLWVLSVLNVVRQRVLVRDPQPFVLPHHFYDFQCYWMRTPLLHTMRFYTAPDSKQFGSGWGYPAPAVWVYQFFYMFDPRSEVLPHWGLGVMVLLAFALMTVGAVMLVRALVREGLRRGAAMLIAGSALLLSWPFFLAAQRGNIEIVLWLPLALAVWAFVRERWMLAAVLIGITASFKLYPILLLGLFLPRRRFREILVGLLLPVLVTTLALAYMGPTLPVAWHEVGLGVSGFLAEHGEHINWVNEGFNHSLFHLVKMRLLDRPEVLPTVLPRYMVVVGAVMLVVFFGRVIRMPVLNQVFVLVISMIFLPPTSYDYTLLVLLVPWTWLVWWIVRRRSEGVKARGALPVMVLLLLVLGPEFFLALHQYTFGGSFKAVCLAVLLVCVCAYPFGETEVQGSYEPAEARK